MPSWVSAETIKLKEDRDKAKKRYLKSRSGKSRKRWKKLNNDLNKSYQNDETEVLNTQLEELKTADENRD